MSGKSPGARQAAIVISLLGEDSAAEILKNLDEFENTAILTEVARLKTISPLEHSATLTEFERMILETRSVEKVGLERAKKLLDRYAPEKSDDMVERIGKYSEAGVEEVTPIASQMPSLPSPVYEATARTLSRALKGEHEQTIAFVLSAISPQKAGRVLEGLPLDVRIEVSRRMAEFETVNPQILAEIGEVLTARIAELSEEGTVAVNGVQAAADCIAALGRSGGREVLEALESESPELVAQLRDLLFSFDMVAHIDDRDLPEVLKQVDRSTLALALKGADPELSKKFFRGMSERAAKMLEEHKAGK